MDSWLETFARANFRRSGDTAHDLKTPLNVAVLNLELLRMRLAKLGIEPDEKVASSINAIETELRRLARIFDTFFLLSTPPNDEELSNVDLPALARDAANATGNELNGGGRAVIRAHDSRMRQGFKLFFEGASKLFPPPRRPAAARIRDGRFEVSIAGTPDGEGFEISNVFRFHYTDAAGNPDLSLTAARLIVETYGGALDAIQDHDKVVLRLSFPLGDP